MTQTLLIVPLLLGLSQGMPVHTPSLSIQTSPAVQYVAEKPKEDDDPGKAITDDPHGPGPYGHSSHDEVHDKSMPANNLDPYGNKKD